MSIATLPTERPALTAKGAATRSRIVEAAAKLVRQHGAARTSIDEVRAEARVSASQLYHYFSDKKELVRAVVAHEAAVAVAEQQPQLASLDSVESLRAWRDAIVAQAQNRGTHGWSPLGSLASELIDTDPDAQALLVDGFELWLAPVESGLAAMRASGALRGDVDTRSLAVGLLAALQGGLLISRLHESTAPLEVALDAAIARVESFAPRQPEPPANISGIAPRQPLAPAVRRTPASPSRASAALSGTPDAPTTPGTSAHTPRTPLRPRRPAGR
jgi:TetR/AcrR family transcriptional repressor of nem operon